LRQQHQNEQGDAEQQQCSARAMPYLGRDRHREDETERADAEGAYMLQQEVQRLAVGAVGDCDRSGSDHDDAERDESERRTCERRIDAGRSWQREPHPRISSTARVKTSPRSR
jgi:hypothetical protein